MKAVLLDADTLGTDIDLGPIEAVVDSLRVYATTSAGQLEQHLADAELILTNKVVIPASVMSGRRAILVLATGMNNIDLSAAAEHKLPVFNVANYGTDSVAQHTLMLMLALAAKLPQYQQDLRAGLWQQSPHFCMLQHGTLSLAGKQLVLVGEGALGRRFAHLATALEMKVSFTARPGRTETARPALDDLLSGADVISFHCPLTEHTRHLLNAERLQRIKRGCLVINCARGGVIDEDAALQALIEGRLGGLAVDVLPEEPPRQGHALLQALDAGLNLIVTPHNAWIAREARQNIIEMTAQSIASFLSEQG